MTDYLTEQEQIQQLKSWFKNYGLTILIGIAIALVMNAGWQFWQHSQDKRLTHASAVFDEMLTFRAQGNMNSATIQAKKLLSHYSKTPYATMAAFMLAHQAVVKGDYPQAIMQLQNIIDHSHTKSIKEVARLRIARILIAENNPQQALNLLKIIDDKNFVGLIDEIKGDAYSALNNTAAASKAYQLALQELPNAEVSRPILQMKLDNLAT